MSHIRSIFELLLGWCVVHANCMWYHRLYIAYVWTKFAMPALKFPILQSFTFKYLHLSLVSPTVHCMCFEQSLHKFHDLLYILIVVYEFVLHSYRGWDRHCTAVMDTCLLVWCSLGCTRPENMQHTTDSVEICWSKFSRKAFVQNCIEIVS